MHARRRCRRLVYLPKTLAKFCQLEGILCSQTDLDMFDVWHFVGLSPDEYSRPMGIAHCRVDSLGSMVRRHDVSHSYKQVCNSHSFIIFVH